MVSNLPSRCLKATAKRILDWANQVDITATLFRNYGTGAGNDSSARVRVRMNALTSRSHIECETKIPPLRQSFIEERLPDLPRETDSERVRCASFVLVLSNNNQQSRTEKRGERS